QLLLRTPVYPHQAYQENSLSDRLDSVFFKAAIQLASPALYRELEKQAFQPESLSPKALLAVRKYLNRMRYRPTPFGLFSSFAVADWADEPNTNLLLDSERLQAHAQLSFRHAQSLAGELLQSWEHSIETYQVNGARYHVAGACRFLRFEEDPEQGDRTFFVDAV